MTVERARELLKSAIITLSDQEVSEMIGRDSAFMEELLELLTTGTIGDDNGIRCD